MGVVRAVRRDVTGTRREAGGKGGIIKGAQTCSAVSDWVIRVRACLARWTLPFILALAAAAWLRSQHHIRSAKAVLGNVAEGLAVGEIGKPLKARAAVVGRVVNGRALGAVGPLVAACAHA